ncbi:CKP2L protein, partial [Aegotheles bennettii]|nr:CKP2L protein [Aegotheles bennettii]
RKQLEEWVASKGKTYKRPPMMLLQKQAVKLSCRTTKEKEKQEDPEQLCLEKMDSVLTECLKLIEEGAREEEVSAMLSHVPRAEQFAKFWICRAKLLARSGPFDVTGLYQAAVCAGAVPIQELREVVLGMLKATNQTSEGNVCVGGVVAGAWAGRGAAGFAACVKAEPPIPWAPTTPGPGEMQPPAATPCGMRRSLPSLPPSIKLQITSAARGKELPEQQEVKFLTPVRRSLRIERGGSRYPEMLKDHDPVVASLEDILDAEEDTQFFFCRNKALP